MCVTHTHTQCVYVYALEYLKIGPVYCMKEEYQVYGYILIDAHTHTGQTWYTRVISRRKRHLISWKQREWYMALTGGEVLQSSAAAAACSYKSTLFLSVHEQFDCGMRGTHSQQ